MGGEKGGGVRDDGMLDVQSEIELQTVEVVMVSVRPVPHSLSSLSRKDDELGFKTPQLLG